MFFSSLYKLANISVKLLLSVFLCFFVSVGFAQSCTKDITLYPLDTDAPVVGGLYANVLNGETIYYTLRKTNGTGYGAFPEVKVGKNNQGAGNKYWNYIGTVRPDNALHSIEVDYPQAAIGNFYYLTDLNDDSVLHYYQLNKLGDNSTYTLEPRRYKSNGWWAYLGTAQPQQVCDTNALNIHGASCSQEIIVNALGDTKTIGDVFANTLDGEMLYYKLRKLKGNGDYGQFPTMKGQTNQYWYYLGAVRPDNVLRNAEIDYPQSAISNIHYLTDLNDDSVLHYYQLNKVEVNDNSYDTLPNRYRSTGWWNYLGTTQPERVCEAVDESELIKINSNLADKVSNFTDNKATIKLNEKVYYSLGITYAPESKIADDALMISQILTADEGSEDGLMFLSYHKVVDPTRKQTV